MSEGSQFGSTIESGDFNDDGFTDLAIGAPFSNSGARSWNGSVSVVYGSEYWTPKEYDLSSSVNTVTFPGEFAGDQFGTSLAAGDYNGDGIDDLAVGAYNGYFETTRPGKTYIYFGGVDMGSHIAESGFRQPDRELTGRADGDGFGLSLSTQDLDGDDLDDLLIGAPFVSTEQYTEAGAAYIHYGDEIGFRLLFEGNSAEERFGSYIDHGDIDGDGIEEIFVSAYFAKNALMDHAGKVYIYKDKELAYEVAGIENAGWFGFSMDVEDYNLDGIDDLAVGEFAYWGDKEGSIYLYLGGEEFDTTNDHYFAFDGGEELLGSSVQISDINEDGYMDVIGGAPGVGDTNSYSSGDVYVFYGGEEEVISSIHGENADDWFGYRLDVVDFDMDGNKDLIVGSRYSDTLEDGSNNGKVFMFLGENEYLGKKIVYNYDSESEISRAEFVRTILDEFELKTEKANLIQSCYEYREFCLFNFMAMSSYDGIALEPALILYPDVDTTHDYYDDINTATILGLVNGYLTEMDSPFHPENAVTRIQALKIALSAADLVPPKYRFEMIDILGSLEELHSQTSYFEDINSLISYMWWYPRYTNFAVENGIIDDAETFRPDQNITKEELIEMIVRTKLILSEPDEETSA